jgi:3-oxoacyl-[acyl-carrier protein] reductase
MGLDGKVAIVTGAAHGIGRAMAFDLAKHGRAVALADLRLAETPAVCVQIAAQGQRALALTANVADSAETPRCVDADVKEFGHVDILVNNASINRDAAAWRMTEAQWDEVHEADLKGCFNLTGHVITVDSGQSF